MTGDPRATLTRLWERAHGAAPDDVWPLVVQVTNPALTADVPPGLTLWAVGPWPGDPRDDWHEVVQPTLDPLAPLSIQRRLIALTIALATGRCPMCGETARLTREPTAPGEPGRAVFLALPLYVAVRHLPQCPADAWTDDERQWFPTNREGDTA